MDNQMMGLGDLSLRKVRSTDDCFLNQLFLSCRPHLAQIPMPAEFVNTVVQQQRDLQRSSYARQFPEYVDFLIRLHHEPIGHLSLHGDYETGRLQVLDIGLLPEHRGRGYGSTLLRSLQNLAAKNEWVLGLSVDRQNWRAKKLYNAMGFCPENTSSSHEGLIWTSAAYAG